MDRILVTSVPTTRIPTLYSQIGEALPIAGFLVVLVALGAAVRRR